MGKVYQQFLARTPSQKQRRAYWRRCKREHPEYSARWCEINREQLNDYARAYYYRNRKDILEKARARYKQTHIPRDPKRSDEETRLIHNEYRAEWRERNRIVINEYNKREYQRRREQICASRRERYWRLKEEKLAPEYERVRAEYRRAQSDFKKAAKRKRKK